MKLSKLACEIAKSPTFALKARGATLSREHGEAVINLGIGEPKNQTPIAAVLASAAKLTSGEVKYTPPDGVASLKKAVIRYTEENYDRIGRTRERDHYERREAIAVQHLLFVFLNPKMK